MMLWLRSRRAHVLGTTLIVILVLGTLAGQRAVVLPAIIGTGANGVLLATFLPLAWAAAVADGFSSRTQAVNLRPSPAWLNVSRVGAYDALLFCGTAALTAASFATWAISSAPAFAGVGPVLILSGVSGIGTVLFSSAHGVFAASALTIFTTIYGPSAPASAYVRVLQQDGDVAWSIILGLVLCAAATWALLTDHVTHAVGETDC